MTAVRAILLALLTALGLAVSAAAFAPAVHVYDGSTEEASWPARRGVGAALDQGEHAGIPVSAASPRLYGTSANLARAFARPNAYRSAPNTAGVIDDTTRVGRWMGQTEFDSMSSTGRVVEGGGGRTFVVEPPNPSACPSARPGSVYAEFDVPTASLHPASNPAWRVIPGPNVTTTRFGPPPPEMPTATCIVLVCRS